MNLLDKYIPAELAKKTIEDMERRKELKIKSEKEYSMLIRQKIKRKLIEKNKKFYNKKNFNY